MQGDAMKCGVFDMPRISNAATSALSKYLTTMASSIVQLALSQDEKALTCAPSRKIPILRLFNRSVISDFVGSYKTNFQIFELCNAMMKLPVVLAVMASLASQSWAKDAICGKNPYALFAHLSTNAEALRFCSQYFPLPSVTETTTPVVTTTTVQLEIITTKTTSILTVAGPPFQKRGGNGNGPGNLQALKKMASKLVSVACSCIQTPQTVTVGLDPA